jgi:catechol 2,3-dioxygenase-like lactoylglutathione lyase family enzyme
MLEVPEAERKAAEIEIGAVPDTQILVTRSSYAEGFDQPYAALSIAADNLRVIDVIYAWARERTSTQPSPRIVLNSGERLSLADHTAGSMVAAIRSDQPWIEHAIPRIGDHVDPSAPGAAVAVQSEAARRSVTIERVNFLSINVQDLRRAERFYTDFFDMSIVARARRADGRIDLIGDDYDWEQAIVSETEADETYLRNGPLVLALHRVGVGARMDWSVIDRFSIRVDGATYNRLKAKVLVGSFETLGEDEAAFRFRDPFGVAWEIGVAGMLPVSLREALGL